MKYEREQVTIRTPGGGICATAEAACAFHADEYDAPGPGPAAELKARRARDAKAFEDGTTDAQWQRAQREREAAAFNGRSSGSESSTMPTEGRGPTPGFTDAAAELARHRAASPDPKNAGKSFTELMLERSRAMFEAG